MNLVKFFWNIMVKSILVIGVGSFRHQNVHLGSCLLVIVWCNPLPPHPLPGFCMLTVALCKIKKLSQRQSSILQKLLGALHIQLAVQHWTEQKERDSMYVVYYILPYNIGSWAMSEIDHFTVLCRSAGTDLRPIVTDCSLSCIN